MHDCYLVVIIRVQNLIDTTTLSLIRYFGEKKSNGTIRDHRCSNAPEAWNGPASLVHMLHCWTVLALLHALVEVAGTNSCTACLNHQSLTAFVDGNPIWKRRLISGFHCDVTLHTEVSWSLVPAWHSMPSSDILHLLRRMLSKHHRIYS